MDNTATDGQQAGSPLGLGLSELLGPLPEAEFHCGDMTNGETAYTEEQMRAYALAEVLKERERCAKLCERQDWPGDSESDYLAGCEFAKRIRA